MVNTNKTKRHFELYVFCNLWRNGQYTRRAEVLHECLGPRPPPEISGRIRWKLAKEERDPEIPPPSPPRPEMSQMRAANTEGKCERPSRLSFWNEGARREIRLVASQACAELIRQGHENNTLSICPCLSLFGPCSELERRFKGCAGAIVGGCMVCLSHFEILYRLSDSRDIRRNGETSSRREVGEVRLRTLFEMFHDVSQMCVADRRWDRSSSHGYRTSL